MTHTPGPWRMSDGGWGSGYAVDSEGRVSYPSQTRICSTRPYPRTKEAREEARANARLIAAAPALLEALEDVQDWYRSDLPIKIAQKVSNAIALAKGENK